MESLKAPFGSYESVKALSPGAAVYTGGSLLIAWPVIVNAVGFF
jgi:hypothetical protein